MNEAEFNYKEENLKFWDERAEAHAKSIEYNVDSFLQNPAYISPTVTFDLPLLGDISGLDCIHLQCHIGTDTLSLARLGARKVTGLDFSHSSIGQARSLARQTFHSGGDKLTYIRSDLNDTMNVTEPGSYDLVFTGIGSLCWLPRISKWAEIVSKTLRPGGRLFLREAHPVLWTLDQKGEGSELGIKYPYFEQPEPLICDHATSYVTTGETQFQAVKTGEFNHGMGEIIQALLDQGMEITGLKEHTSVPWKHLAKQMEMQENGEWSVKERPWRLPHTYTLQARKKQ